MKKLEDYFVGFDIGTNSVGWAVTDENYYVPKFNGKKMWGIRLFDKADTAEDRRIQRGARRRLNRKRERINLLQDLFAEEIFNIDKNFFIRLKNSDLYQEDKDEKLNSKYTLFNDDNFKDRNFHKKYPTVHHLIMDLIEDDSKKDLRLVYLACHYLLKNRGHFIFEGKQFNMDSSFDRAINNLLTHLKDKYDVYIDINNKDLIEVITNNKLNKTEKKVKLKDVVGDSKFLKAISAIMIGSSQNFADLFDDEDLKDAEKTKVEFSKGDFEENYSQYESVLGDKIELINILKEIYDASVLHNLIKDADKSPDNIKYISSAFVNKYKKHAEDLKKLKNVVKGLRHKDKDYFKSQYFEIFRSEKISNNYVAYTKSNITNNKRTKADKFTKKDDFYSFIKGKLDNIKNFFDENLYSDKKILTQIDEILKDIELKIFMPKLKVSDNGVIPYQLKLEELQKILNNQSKYYEFLNDADNYGSLKDKIISIMTFRVPYYVGPLNENSKFAWINRKEGKINPWNFNDLVNLEASREEFIDRLIGRCTYLKNEVVLPKSSLLYNEFMVLNELNKLKLNDQPISEDLKNIIFDKLFKNYKKVTLKKVQNLIKQEYNYMSEIILTGTDGDFKQGLNSYLDFKNIIGNKIDEEDYKSLIEEIIKLIVLYADDKKYLKKKIKSAYGKYFTDDEIKSMSSLNYKDWGRLSKKLLIGTKGINKSTGETGNIMHFMHEYNFNLMELMSDNFSFTDEIKKLDLSDVRGLSYDIVNELYLSPSVKRMLWQSLKILNEIRNIMGKDPKKIFIEMAREKEENKTRKKSRKNKLLDFYKYGKNEFIKEIGSDEYNKMYENIKNEDENKFRWDNLYLYYIQLGRCMYSLEPIDIDKLNNQNLYDQDHIYPKSKIYDDSIENRVLVKKDLNSQKGNIYPIPNEVLNQKCYGFWKILYDKNLIGNKKYSRLTRRTPFTEDDLTAFIDRQIVETRQATKETANLLKKLCENSEIVYSKAENVSRFRQEFDIVKCRSVNDLHHMHDAYLNIVVGNVYNTKFTKNPRNFVKSGEKAKGYNLENMFKYDVKRGNYTAWIAYNKEKGNKDATIIKVKNEIKNTNFRFTRMSYTGSGELYDQNLLRKGKGQISQKQNSVKSNIEKYGGYNKASSAFFCLVESEGKHGKEKTLETVPILVHNRIKTGDNNALQNYLVDILGLKNPKILYEMIKINSLIKIDGFYYNITGKTNNYYLIAPAQQLLLSNENQRLIKNIDKFLQKQSANKNAKITSVDGIQEEKLISLYNILYNKLQHSIFNNRTNNLVDIVSSGNNLFINLNLEDKVYVINQILQLFQKVNNGVDLSKIGNINKKKGTPIKQSGIALLSKKLKNIKELKLINQSITGLFENEVDLLKL